MLTLEPSLQPDPHMLVRPLYALMNLQLADGQLESGAQTAWTLVQTASSAKAPATQAWAQLALGAVAYELNDLERAAEYFRAGASLCYASNVRAGQECLTGLALTHQAQGRNDEAQGVIAIILDYHRDHANPSLTADTLSLRSHLALCNGDVAAARRWLGDTRGERGLMFGWLENPSITRVRLEVADLSGGDLHYARQEVDRLLGIVQRLHQPRRQVELLALKAVICERLGERIEALNQLRAALALAEPLGLIRTIVDIGPAIVPLLKAVAQGGSTAYVMQLLEVFQQNVTASDEPEVQLTRREREVLMLLGQRRTDREIAEELVVSTVTVRTHIDHLAEKLGVRGRRAIVTRAREMGLLT